jgi:glycosyltransferase involved in cell wall biosynthesis
MNKFVSVIVPCRNEAKYIGHCLDSILAQDYPKDCFEVLVIDGGSQDGTKGIVESFMKNNANVRLLANHRKVTPCALNIGIKEARGDIVVRMDAHAAYEDKYISKCVKYLFDWQVENVGSQMITLPANDTLIARAIAKSISCRFGVGNSYFRTGVDKPTLVDTVFGGCYRKDIFERIGLFNERLARGQDMEFNLRLKRAGLKTLLAPDILSYYYSKPDISSFIRHNFINGVWAILPFKYTNIVPISLRSLVPLFFVLSLIVFFIAAVLIPVFFILFAFMFLSYLLTNIFFSARIAYLNRDIRYIFLMPLIFICLHFAYGVGSLYGVIKLIFSFKRDSFND